MTEDGVHEFKFGELTIRIPETLAGGTYANLVLVNHSPDDFVVDFCFVEPGTNRATLRSRVIVSPAHYKRLVRALESNLRRYEETFGTIQEPTPPGPAPETVN